MWVQGTQIMKGRDAPAYSPPVYLFWFFLHPLRVGVLKDIQLASHLMIEFSGNFPVKYF